MVSSTSSSMAVSASSSSSTASDPSEFTLISSDNQRFFIPSTASALSTVIKRKLRNKAWPENVVVLKKYDGKTLEPVAEYLRGNGQASDDEEMKRRFKSEFLSLAGSVDVLFNTAQDLEIPGLVDLVCEQIIAGARGRISSRLEDWVRRAFEDGFASDEEDDQPEQLPIQARNCRWSRNLMLLCCGCCGCGAADATNSSSSWDCFQLD